MFGNNNNPPPASNAEASPPAKSTNPPAPPPLNTAAVTPPPLEKKRRGSISKASAFIASARNSLSGLGSSNEEKEYEKAIKQDVSTVPVGPHNNSAGDSRPGPKSTFRVGVTEDKNKKCRRTMEDTHSYLYNFLQTSTSNPPGTSSSTGTAASGTDSSLSSEEEPVDDSDNGYFAIFDGHAGTYAADWCGKKLHLVLEETIRKNPNTPIPELLDITFTNCDGQLEKLPVKNSGCTAVCAVLRWEERRSPTALAEAPKENGSGNNENAKPAATQQNERQRVLYTANVGDARIVLCRSGKALRLSYDHKGSDENEGKRVANAGGLILNNRVNGVLAVTRALGDSYMKELVTGHPYTTETVLQPEADEFIILACDGLWDVCSDQEAVDLVRQVQDPQEASKMLVDYALGRFSSDNLSCMIVRLDPTGKFNGIKGNDSSEPKEGAPPPLAQKS